MHGPAPGGPEADRAAELARGGARLPPLPAASAAARPRPRHGVQAGAAAAGPAACRRLRNRLRLPGDRGRLGWPRQRAPSGRAGRQGRRGGEPQAGRHLREYRVPPGASRAFVSAALRPAAPLSLNVGGWAPSARFRFSHPLSRSGSQQVLMKNV